MWYYVVFHPSLNRLLPILGPLSSMDTIDPYKQKAIDWLCKRDPYAWFYDFYVVRSNEIRTSPFNQLVEIADQMTVTDCLRARLLWDTGIV